MLAVAVTLATPEALVTAMGLDRVALAPVGGAAKDTVTPDSGFPPESFTVACRAVAKAVPTETDCGVPPVAVILAGCVVLVSGKDAESIPMLAVTMYLPVTKFGVAVILATPEPLVNAVWEDRIALAPLEGAVKLIAAPLKGIPLFSTVTCEPVFKPDTVPEIVYVLVTHATCTLVTFAPLTVPAPEVTVQVCPVGWVRTVTA